MGAEMNIVKDITQSVIDTKPEVTLEGDSNQFWQKKTNAKDPNKYVIIPKLTYWMNYLRSLGIAIESKGGEMVRFEDGIVSKLSVNDLIRLVDEQIKAFPEYLPGGVSRDEILEMVLLNIDRLYKVKGVLGSLPQIDFDWVKSTATESYFFYRNGIVEVTSDSIEVKPYEAIEGFVWDTAIIDRDFELNEDVSATEWADFLAKVAGGKEHLLKNLDAALGYSLHSFKDSSRPYLVVFGEATHDSSLGGGSGKSLIANALAKIVPTAFKDMKAYSVSDSFKWSMVKPETQLLVLSDLTATFEHQVLYNALSDGFEVNAKNKAVVTYPFEESPKILTTTNYSLSNDSGHGDRRLRLVEFSSHWNSQTSPADYYGKLFFSDWDEKEWADFDSYMMLTVVEYLRNGFPKIDESEGSKSKRILNKSGMYDLVEFVNNYDHKEIRSFSDIYLEYTRSQYITSKPVGKPIFTKRIEDAVTISNGKQIEVTEYNGSKMFRIW